MLFRRAIAVVFAPCNAVALHTQKSEVAVADGGAFWGTGVRWCPTILGATIARHPAVVDGTSVIGCSRIVSARVDDDGTSIFLGAGIVFWRATVW